MKAAPRRVIRMNDQEFDWVLRRALAETMDRPVEGNAEDRETAARIWVHFDRLAKSRGLKP